MNFTPRQDEIVQLLLEACTTAEIAERLSISTNTVKVHISNVFRAVGVNSRVELVSRIMAEQIRGAKQDVKSGSELLKEHLVREANAARTGSVQTTS